MRRAEREMVAMIALSAVALAVMVAFFYWPTDICRVPADDPQTAAAVRSDRPGAAESADGRFVDVSASSGLTFHHFAGETLKDIRQVMSPGVGLADFDGDGRLDVFIPGTAAGPTSGNTLFHNLGAMRFERVPDAGGASSGEEAMGCAIADFDNDGDLDIYVTALGPNRLYVNDGRGRFSERASAAGVDDPRWGAGAAWGDYDRDGRLDLYVANYVRFSQEQVESRVGVRSDRDEPPAFTPYIFDAEPDVLYRNVSEPGAPRFLDVTSATGISDPAGKGMGVLFADLSGDDWPDLLVINDVSTNLHFHNTGGRFTDAGLVSGLADPRSGMGVALGDYDGDGWFDLFATHWQDESNVLYRNLSTVGDGTPMFDDVTITERLAAPSIGLTGWGTCMADFDQDGDLDLLVVNGYTSPSPTDPRQCIGQRALYFVREKGRFENHAEQLGLAGLAPFASRGAAAGDLDDDGDLDLVVTTNNGPAFVFENRLARGHYIKVKPAGQAVGCVVHVRCGGESQQRMIVAGSSYLSSEPLEAHFGVGSSTQIDRVTVSWADGRIVEQSDVPANRTLMVQRP